MSIIWTIIIGFVAGVIAKLKTHPAVNRAAYLRRGAQASACIRINGATALAVAAPE